MKKSDLQDIADRLNDVLDNGWEILESSSRQVKGGSEWTLRIRRRSKAAKQEGNDEGNK